MYTLYSNQTTQLLITWIHHCVVWRTSSPPITLVWRLSTKCPNLQKLVKTAHHTPRSFDCLQCLKIQKLQLLTDRLQIIIYNILISWIKIRIQLFPKWTKLPDDSSWYTRSSKSSERIISYYRGIWVVLSLPVASFPSGSGLDLHILYFQIWIITKSVSVLSKSISWVTIRDWRFSFPTIIEIFSVY